MVLRGPEDGVVIQNPSPEQISHALQSMKAQKSVSLAAEDGRSVAVRTGMTMMMPGLVFEYRQSPDQKFTQADADVSVLQASEAMQRFASGDPRWDRDLKMNQRIRRRGGCVTATTKAAVLLLCVIALLTAACRYLAAL